MSMISYQRAVDSILSTVIKPQSLKLSLHEAAGKVASCDVNSPMQVPSFRNSAMDGFAVCASLLTKAGMETPVTLRVGAAIAAGDALSIYDKSAAVQIMTGAPVPECYDAVVPVELISKKDSEVTFTKSASVGDNIRNPGEDVSVGEYVLRKSEKITPEKIMLLSALGIDHVQVAALPSVHIISTGNEVTDDYKTTLQDAQIYNSNAPYLIAACRGYGLNAKYEGLVRDDSILFESKLKAIDAPAIIISTGAVSKGEWDFIPDTLRRVGATIHFHRVNIRPGKPVLFATLPNGSFYFGLPGNPVSTVIGFTFFVMPLLCALQGMPQPKPYMATLQCDFTKKGDFVQFLKSVLTVSGNGQLQVSIAKGQESFKIRPLVECNAWVVLDSSKPYWKAGDAVPVYLYGALQNELNIKESGICQAA